MKYPLIDWIFFFLTQSCPQTGHSKQLLNPGWLEIKWRTPCWMQSNCHRLLLCWWCKCVSSTSLSFLPAPCIASHTFSCRTSSLCLPSNPPPPQSRHRFKGKSISLYPDYHLAPLCNWTVLPSQWDCIGKQYPAEWSSTGSWIARGSTKTVWVL